MLAWGPWLDLADVDARRSIPAEAGLYRVRIRGASDLAYVGQTSSLRDRLSQLSVLYRPEIPFGDPHTGAPCLWVLRVESDAEFEFSILVHDGDVRSRKSLECVVISEHRARVGYSPYANFGRMPDGWVKSSGNTTALREAGKLRRGFRDDAAVRSLDAACVLDAEREPSSADWAGLDWSAWGPIHAAHDGTGLYRLRQVGAEGLAYVGQGKVRQRLRAHQAKASVPDHRQSEFLAGELEASWVDHHELTSQQLMEIECDLIASHVLTVGVPPSAQFLG